MRDHRKYIRKAIFALVVLSVLAGLPIVSAEDCSGGDDGFQWWNPMDYVRAMGGFISEMAADVAEGIGRLVGGILDAVAGVLYQLANFAVKTAIEINLMLEDSQLIKDGFGITQSVANLGIIIGLVVIAFAIITRATWIAEPRKALPKFLTALLLMNFGYFILMYLIVGPANTLTEMIYAATQYTPESFRSTFNPDVDLSPALTQQIAMSKAAGCGIKGENDHQYYVSDVRAYFELKERAIANIIKVLDGFPIPATAIIGGATTVTEAQKLAVASAYVEAVMGLPFFEAIDTFSKEFGTTPTGESITSWNTQMDSIEKKQERIDALSAGGAIYGDLTSNTVDTDGDGEPDSAITSLLLEDMDGAYLAARGEYFSAAECDGSKLGCQYLADLKQAISDQIGSVERVIIVFTEVLFKAIFIFLGVVALFGIACMLFIRYVAISILIILFPFVWYGWIFPKLSTGTGSDMWKSWWSQFIKWVIFAPICLFFLWLAIQLAADISLYTPKADDMEAFAGRGALAMVGTAVGQLLTVLGFLIGGLLVANKMSITGSGMALGVAKAGAKQIAVKGGAAMARLTGRVMGTGAGLAARGAGQITRGAGMGLQRLGGPAGAGGARGALRGLGTGMTRTGAAVDRAGAAITRRSRSTMTDQPRQVVVDRSGRLTPEWRTSTDADGNTTYQQQVGGQWLNRSQREFSEAEGEVVMESYINSKNQLEYRPVNDWRTHEDRNGVRRYEQLINGEWQQRQLQDVTNAGHEIRAGRLGLSTMSDPLGRRQLRTDTSVVDRLRNIRNDPRRVGRVGQAAVETRSAWRSLFNPVNEVWRAASGSVRSGARGGGGGGGQGGRRR